MAQKLLLYKVTHQESNQYEFPEKNIQLHPKFFVIFIRNSWMLRYFQFCRKIDFVQNCTDNIFISFCTCVMELTKIRKFILSEVDMTLAVIEQWSMIKTNLRIRRENSRNQITKLIDSDLIGDLMILPASCRVDRPGIIKLWLTAQKF